jgi:flagellar hook-associated protein 2
MTSFVSSYNAYISNVSTQTAYNTTSNTGGPLEGDATTLNSLYQMQSVVNNLYGSSGSPVRSLLDLGVTVNSDGSLVFDKSVLDNQLQTNPKAVSDFFSTASTGFGAVLTNSINSMTDTTTGSLALESTADQSTIDTLNSQITDLNSLLNSQQTDLYNEFYNMETTLSALQSQQRVLAQFQGQQTTTTTTAAAPTPSPTTSSTSG